MKKQKQILAKLMSLDNKQADKYLLNFAKKIKQDIFQDDNDAIINNLELLKEFIYKVPKEAIAIIQFVVKKKAQSPTLNKTALGEIEGKTHKDLILKCTELLGRIRYIAPDDVLDLIAQLTLWDDKDVSNKALEVAKQFSQYDYIVLTKSKLGYQPQRKILDFMLAWSPEKSLQHIDFVEKTANELLGSSVEGTEMKDEKTLTMKFGAVDPTDYLKKIRRDTIDFICDLYEKTDDPEVKLRLVNILDEVTSTPHNVKYGDNIIEMINKDLEYLVGKYQKMIFGKTKNEILADLGVVKAIEDRLYWINKWRENKTERSDALRNKILKNKHYKLFRLLVGDAFIQQEDDWKAAEEKRSKELNSLISSIDDSNYNEWFENLDKIATQNKTVEDWEFNPLRSFIQRLTKLKPDIADKILDLAYKNNSPLIYFMGSFLNGFRLGKHFAQWDKCVDKIIEEKDTQLVKAIIYSLHLPEDADLETEIRDKDIKILNDIVNRRNRFSFIDPNGREIHHALINTLSRDYESDSESFEKLIVDELKNNPKYSDLFFSEMSFILWKKWIDFKKLKRETINLFISGIIKIPDVDWHAQSLLLAIGKREGLATVMEVFRKRIMQDIKNKENESVLRPETRFNPIPYHFNPEFKDFIAKHPDYLKLAEDWMSKMTTDWSLYNWHISDFLKRIEKSFNVIVMSLIEKGDDESLMKAARALYSVSGADFDICMEIARRTDNKTILSQVRSSMYATGVVSGEYGIAEAYVSKSKSLEKYKGDKSKRVRKFVQQMIKDLKESAARERKRADEEIQLRKIEFEG